ncbi:hypothetical protein HELRODRAFT_185893 [Helobdella robusta]|uniref:RING finger protein 141 n=1 Tax=Helobdella robusta TaxID=6412 RepID=T1FNE6_HELRO|nr:hypothetical protein HELRODRAFT_185893 [Helobdella robusta]ESN97736.1 hypothetical protein HELRODRAFT_185893 [Helobdella robusta]
MGQHQMKSAVPNSVSVISENLFRHANELKQTTMYSYESFVESISILNTITQGFDDGTGKKLIFCIKDGTDTSVFWRGLVRVKCHKVNSQTGVIETVRLLNLKQYIHLYNEILSVQAEKNTNSTNNDDAVVRDSPVDPPFEQSNFCTGGANSLDASIIIDRLDEARRKQKKKSFPARKEGAFKEEEEDDDDDDDGHDRDHHHHHGYDDDDDGEMECVICMDRKAQIILPCLHQYCEQCIDEWQDTHHSCPVCRASVDTSEDAWVLSEKPDEQEVDEQTTRSIMQLVDSFPPDRDDDPDYSTG